VTDDISNDLKLCVGVERSVAGSRIRKAVPPPTMWDFVALIGAGRGQLIRVNPGGVALKSSAEVDAEVIQVSVRAKRSI
jgi:hypothetical protein